MLQYNASIPATESHQWDIQTYSFTLTYLDVDRILPTRSPDTYDLITDTNRPISRRHSSNCTQFILNTPDSPLGTIMIAADPDTCVYENGEILLDLESVHIIDGQHRRLSIRNAIHELENSGDGEKLRDVQNRKINILMFATKENSKIQQLFRWANLNRPIDKATASIFDHDDPFNNAAYNLIEQSSFLREFVGRISGETKVTTDWLLTLDENNDILKLAKFGPLQNFTGKAIKTEYSGEEEQQEIIDAGIKFWHEFMPAAVPAIAELAAGNMNRMAISTVRKSDYGLRPAFFKCLAVIFNAWDTTEGDPEPLAKYIAFLDKAEEQIDESSTLVRLKLIDPATGKIATKKSRELAEATRVICREVNDQLKNQIT